MGLSYNGFLIELLNGGTYMNFLKYKYYPEFDLEVLVMRDGRITITRNIHYSKKRRNNE